MMFESCIIPDQSFLNFIENQSQFWILGNKFNDGDSHLSSDAGWGCMIRSGQMLLAECLSRYIHNYQLKDIPFNKNHNTKVLDANNSYELFYNFYNNAKRYLSEIWYNNNLSPKNCELNGDSCNCYHRNSNSSIKPIKNYIKNTNLLKLLKMFLDDPKCLFSIHNISTSSPQHRRLTISLDEDSKSSNIIFNNDTNYAVPGKWFGPNSVAQAMKQIINNQKSLNIIAHVAMDNTLIMSEIEQLFSVINQDEPVSESTSNLTPLNKNLSLLLIIPLRLGLNDVIPAYFDAIKAFFQLPQSIGILGGKPKHASWFVGYTDDYLIYLDPHYVQKAWSLEEFEIAENKFLASEIKCIDNKKLDPPGDKRSVDDEIKRKLPEDVLATDFFNFLQTFHCNIPDESEEIKEDPPASSDPQISSERIPSSSITHQSLIEPKFMPFKTLDPSLCLGFFCKDYDDLLNLRNEMQKQLIDPFTCPMFEILEKPLPLWDNKNDTEKITNDKGECEDFEVI